MLTNIRKLQEHRGKKSAALLCVCTEISTDRSTRQRRFKSSYIFFSTEKHKEIRVELGEKGNKEKVSVSCGRGWI